MSIAEAFQKLKRKAATAKESSQQRLRVLIAKLADGRVPTDLESAIAEQGLDEAQLEQLVADQIERRRLVAIIAAGPKHEVERVRLVSERAKLRNEFLAAQNKLEADYLAADSALASTERTAQAAVDDASAARLSLRTRLVPTHLAPELAAARAAYDEHERHYRLGFDFGPYAEYKSAEREQVRQKRDQAARLVGQLEARCAAEVD